MSTYYLYRLHTRVNSGSAINNYGEWQIPVPWYTDFTVLFIYLLYRVGARTLYHLY